MVRDSKVFLLVPHTSTQPQQIAVVRRKKKKVKRLSHKFKTWQNSLGRPNQIWAFLCTSAYLAPWHRAATNCCCCCCCWHAPPEQQQQQPEEEECLFQQLCEFGGETFNYPPPPPPPFLPNASSKLVANITDYFLLLQILMGAETSDRERGGKPLDAEATPPT